MILVFTNIILIKMTVNGAPIERNTGNFRQANAIAAVITITASKPPSDVINDVTDYSFATNIYPGTGRRA
jgi:hypothetical protein